MFFCWVPVSPSLSSSVCGCPFVAFHSESLTTALVEQVSSGAASLGPGDVVGVEGFVGRSKFAVAVVASSPVKVFGEPSEVFILTGRLELEWVI